MIKKKKNKNNLILTNMSLIIKVSQQFDEEFNPTTLNVHEFENTTGSPIVFTKEDVGNYISNALSTEGQLYSPFYFEPNGAGGRFVVMKNDAGFIVMSFEARKIRLECFDLNAQAEFNSLVNDNHWFHLPPITIYPE